MTVFRTRRSQKIYDAYLAHQEPGCEFCRIEEGNPQFVKATKTFKVIKNRFPYAVWDGQTVGDHLMVVPKKHLESMTSFTPEQAAEYLKLVSNYEANGYHLYARAMNSIERTLAHQHTHLIKGVGNDKQFILQVSKPHILLFK